MLTPSYHVANQLKINDQNAHSDNLSIKSIETKKIFFLVLKNVSKQNSRSFIYSLIRKK